VPSAELAINCYRVIFNPDIPLAMYRELASHIEQIADVKAELYWQKSTEFSYLGSQIGGMWLSYPTSISSQSQILIKNILDHYGTWNSETTSE